MVTVACDGVGPVLLVSPRSLDWGTVPVLCCSEKQVTIKNDSPISAEFSAFMVTTILSFVCDISECEIVIYLLLLVCWSSNALSLGEVWCILSRIV